MNIREHISALCPQPISLEVTTFTPYDPEEIAYALAGLTTFQANLMRYKYALEKEWFEPLRDDWIDQLTGSHTFAGRELNRTLTKGHISQMQAMPGMRESLAELSFIDTLDHYTCVVCKGVGSKTVTDSAYIDGEVKNKGSQVICFSCAGLGRRPQSMTQRASIYGVPRETWRRKWEPIFTNMSSLINSEEVHAARIVTQRLGRY